MMRTPAAGTAAAIALLALTACGQQAFADPGPAAGGSARHSLTVTTKIKPGRHGEIFIEGALPQIRLIAKDGTRIKPRRDHVQTPVFANLVAGRYVLRAVLRPCDGNCGNLDAPISPCRTVVHIPEDQSARVTWRVGENCHAH